MMTRIRWTATLALLLTFALAGAAPAAAKSGWELLGERTVTDAMDHDSIVVGKVEGTFQSIRIKVFERAVQFHRVTIFFGKGVGQEVELKTVIPAGGQSRIIDLVGDDRVIKRIDFVYDAQSLGGKSAVVRVFGRK